MFWKLNIIHFLLIFLQYLISDTLGCRLVFICHKYLQCICCDLQKTSRAKWPGSPGVSPLSLGRHRTSVRTTLVTLQNHPRVCGAVLCCAIISLSNFLFSIAWLIWLQRLGHNYSTFYSHSVFHQSYFLENFDSGTIIIFGILWRTTWTRLISLCIYISTAIYQNAESTNGDIQVKVSSVWQQREMWICEGHNSGAVAESLYANTLSHGHGQTSATVDTRQRE